MGEVWEDPGYREWEEHIRHDVLPMIEGSAATITLVPGGETDIKFAVELGLSIMLDKPIIMLVAPGMKIPTALARVADELVEVDVKADADGAQQSISRAFSRVMRSRAGHISLDDQVVECDGEA